MTNATLQAIFGADGSVLGNAAAASMRASIYTHMRVCISQQGFFWYFFLLSQKDLSQKDP